MANVKWYLKGDSDLTTIWTNPETGFAETYFMGKECARIGGGNYLQAGINGVDCRDVILSLPGDLASFTFDNFILCIGSNENDLITNPGRDVYNHLVYDFMKGYADKLKIIMDMIPTTTTKTLIFTQPRTVAYTEFLVYRARRDSNAKLGRAVEIDFCVRNNIKYVDYFSEVIRKTATDYTVDTMASYYSEGSGDSDWGHLCAMMIGRAIPTAVVPSRTRYTGKTNAPGGNGDGWDTGKLTGSAVIVGDAAWGSLSLPSIGDAYRTYVHAHGPLPTSALKYTATTAGDGAKVDIYMRASARNFVRDYEYTQFPWIKTNQLYVSGCPFCQVEVVSKETGAILDSIALTYEVLS